MNGRQLSCGQRVTLGRSAPSMLRCAPVACDVVTLVRPYPGGRYDDGSDSWVVRFPSGAESIASESLMGVAP